MTTRSCSSAAWCRGPAQNLSHLAAHARRVFVVHGEEDPAIMFRERLIDAGFPRVDVPVYREEFRVG